ncbi:Apoptosis-inducing factor 2 [Grifola frondosa]|uniref:Apoptosis-inducing factor 2 n=1 Tax=Grifola frondosa TaxID=5627 RepID=A0A1C7M3R9_GRIFR|nr:Apoptosis-inducing factor 2 [Grifola frondosa]
MSKKNDDKKNIVIVGGGHSGSLLARDLSTKLDASLYNIILINERPYYVILIAGARLNVTSEGALEDRALVPYDKLFINGNGTAKVGKVTAVEEATPGKGGEVVLEDGERIPYTVLVLASGSSWPGPLNFPQTDADVQAHIARWRKTYEAAKHVVVVGGGAVGIDCWGSERCLARQEGHHRAGQRPPTEPAYPDKFRKDIERRVRLQNIEIIFNEQAGEIPPPGTLGLTLKSGKTIPDADLVVPAFGPRANTGFVASLGSDVLTDKGFVKVKPTLELPAHPGVFAVGDIIEWNEQKQAAKAGAHIAVVAANIVSFLQDKPLKKEYKGSLEMIVIPVGKNGGSGYFDVLWGIVVGDFITRLTKAKDLFVTKSRSARGY